MQRVFTSFLPRDSQTREEPGDESQLEKTEKTKSSKERDSVLFSFGSLVQFNKCKSGLPEITQLNTFSKCADVCSEKQQWGRWRGGGVGVCAPDSFPAGTLSSAICVGNGSPIPGRPAAWTETTPPGFSERKGPDAFTPATWELSVLREAFYFDFRTWNMNIQRTAFSNSPESQQTCTEKGKKRKSREGRRSETQGFNSVAIL